MRRAFLDPRVSIRVIARTPLLYAEGPSLAEDRPGHVRAASGVARLGGRLAIVQDDALFVALAETDRAGAVRAVALPRGEGGLRLFGEDRGNKHAKLDLEACFTLTLDDEETLVALGSGSSAVRDRIVLVADGRVPRVLEARRLYDALHAETRFSGSELNVEGATRHGDRVLLASRGNGAPCDGREPLDATVELELAAFVAFLRDPIGSPVPTLGNVTTYDLGTAGGGRLTFTDLTSDPEGDRVLYAAAAEASPDATRDGPVSGCAIGVLGEAPRYGLVHDERGALLTEKIEGIACVPGEPDRLVAVIDVDDPSRPAERLTLALASI